MPLPELVGRSALPLPRDPFTLMVPKIKANVVMLGHATPRSNIYFVLLLQQPATKVNKRRVLGSQRTNSNASKRPPGPQDHSLE